QLGVPVPVSLMHEWDGRLKTRKLPACPATIRIAAVTVPGLQLRRAAARPLKSANKAIEFRVQTSSHTIVASGCQESLLLQPCFHLPRPAPPSAGAPQLCELHPNTLRGRGPGPTNTHSPVIVCRRIECIPA